MKDWLCQAIDANEIVVDILIHLRRNAKAVKCVFADLMTTYGKPRVAITDKLRSYAKPIEAIAFGADHRVHKGFNNQIEEGHIGQLGSGKRS